MLVPKEKILSSSSYFLLSYCYKTNIEIRNKGHSLYQNKSTNKKGKAIERKHNTSSKSKQKSHA